MASFERRSSAFEWGARRSDSLADESGDTTFSTSKVATSNPTTQGFHRPGAKHVGRVRFGVVHGKEVQKISNT